MRIKARTWQALTSAERMGALQNAVDRTKRRWQKKKAALAERQLNKTQLLSPSLTH